ncbi:MAG TPA: cyanophycin synthetase, partial [Bacteroidota bacterium]|nr:cyanophycin synthetase [Bacteroidota bacterium]
FHVPAEGIRNALESFRATQKRMETTLIGDVLLLNDTYNANPDSMKASLNTLAAIRRRGKRIAVLGDMKELGDRSQEDHFSIGRDVADLHIDYVLTYGPLAKWIHEAAGIPGAIHYDQKSVLAEYLSELVAPGDTVLVKGSRGMKMEDVVVFLEQRLQSRS